MTTEVREDRAESGEWCKAAQSNVTWEASDGNSYHIKQGLCSGVRGTSLKNLELQGGYTDTGNAQAAELQVKAKPPEECHKSRDDALLCWLRLIFMIANILAVYASGQLPTENSQSCSLRSAKYLRTCYDEGGAHWSGSGHHHPERREQRLPMDGKLTSMASAVTERVRKGYNLAACVLLKSVVRYVSARLDRKGTVLHLSWIILPINTLNPLNPKP